MIISTILAFTAWQYIGVPYKWGGNDFKGLDCSGLVVKTLQDVKAINKNRDMTAQGLYEWCKMIDGSSSSIVCDSLLFFGRNRDHITHVGISLGRIQGVHMMIEAGGAGKNSLYMSNDDLLEIDARVRVVNVKKRKDFIEGVNVPWNNLIN